jgi:hypothetical protein
MPLYRSPAQRASETVTFRLTIDEKARLDHLARLRGMTLTDLVRGLIARLASEMGVTEIPVLPPKRRPGRPRKKGAPVFLSIGEPVASPPIFAAARPPTSDDPDVTSGRTAPTAGDLVDLFVEHMSKRARGIRDDLDDAISFVTRAHGGARPIISRALPLAEIDDEFLAKVRDSIRTTDLRFPKKNLYLHYLRMMFQWAVRRQDLEVGFGPNDLLPPLTAKEVADAWPSPVARAHDD